MNVCLFLYVLFSVNSSLTSLSIGLWFNLIFSHDKRTALDKRFKALGSFIFLYFNILFLSSPAHSISINLYVSKQQEDINILSIIYIVSDKMVYTGSAWRAITIQWRRKKRRDFPMWGSDNIQREKKFNVKKFNKAKIVVCVERRYKKTSYLLLFQIFYPFKKSKLYIQDGYFLIVRLSTYNKFKKMKILWA